MLFSIAYLIFCYFLKRKSYLKSPNSDWAESLQPNSLSARTAHCRPSFPRARPVPAVGLAWTLRSPPSLARVRSRPLTCGPARGRRPRTAFFSARSPRVRHGLLLQLVRQKGKRPRFFARTTPSRSPILFAPVPFEFEFRTRLYPFYLAFSFSVCFDPRRRHVTPGPINRTPRIARTSVSQSRHPPRPKSPSAAAI